MTVSIEHFLQQLRAEGIHISVFNRTQLKIQTDKNTISDEQKNSIVNRKAEIIAALSSTPLLLQAPLTLEQLRIWLACQKDPTQYHLPIALKINGNIDKKRLSDSFKRLVNRHSILRCSVKEINAQIQLCVDQQPQLVIEEKTLAELGYRNIEHYIQTWFKQKFDLENSALLKASLLTIDEHNCILLINIHHLITDDWSNQLLLAELIELYENPEKKLPQDDYLIYSHQQKNILESLDHNILDLWQPLFAGNKLLQLNHLSDKNNTGKSQPLNCRIDNDLKNRLLIKAKTQQTTLFCVLLSAFQLTLHKLTQQTHFCVLTPTANRNNKDHEKIIGLFANALPLPINFNRCLTKNDFIHYNHHILQSANAVELLPSKIIHLLEKNHTDFNLLQEVAISFQKATSLNLHHTDFTIEILESSNALAKFPLHCHFTDDESLSFSVEYLASHFDAVFIHRFADHLIHTLHFIADNEEENLASWSLLKFSEQKKLLGLDNNTLDSNTDNHHFIPNISLAELIHIQSQKTPNNIALTDDVSSITYAELEKKSSHLANLLYQQVGSNQLIAIALPRSTELSIALLAILKSGNTYLPLDMTWPLNRLENIIKNSQAKVIITNENTLDHCIKNIELHKPCNELKNFIIKTTPNSLLNIIYTSGSTGLPKGVMVSEKSIINRLLWMKEQYAFNEADVFLQKTPITFDVSVWELFLPLLCGARLHFAKPDGHKNSHYLAELIQQQQISTLHFVPSMLQIFLENVSASQMQSVRQVFCSGEALQSYQVALFHDKYPTINCHNLYGPTEAAIDVSYFDTRHPFSSNSCPIGNPIWNTQLHIMDENLQPLAPGCIGEIVIGGTCLAQGYLNNSPLTAKSFVDNPWYLEGHSSAKLYKTGDLGRFLNDGNIEFLGRNDDQIKLRGFRIELGDIEYHASLYPNIRYCAAIVDNDTIILFYNTSSTIQASELRLFLSQYMPGYMLPNHYQQVQDWPINNNGKTDKNTLKALISNDAQKSITAIEAYEPVKKTIQAIWQKHLGKLVDVNADFISAGGHSLQAIRIIADISNAFHKEIKFSDIFNYPTIYLLAEYIQNHAEPTKFTLSNTQALTDIPVSIAQQRLYLFQQLESNSYAYNMACAFLLEGNINIEALSAALNFLITRHDILRTVYYEKNGNIYQKALTNSAWQLAISNSHDQVDFTQLAKQHAQTIVNLHTDLPLQANLYLKNNKTGLLCLCLHHIAGDAISLEILTHEFSVIYQTISKNKNPELTPIQYRYADFSYWQKNQQWDAQLEWWLNDLKNAPELQAIPHDKPRPKKMSYRGACYQTTLATNLAKLIQPFCQRHEITPFVLLLSTLHLFISKLINSNDISIGIPSAGRHHPQTQQMIGFFVNTLIVRAKIDNQQTFAEFIHDQKKHTLDVLDHQDMAIEKILTTLGYIRPTQYTPISQIAFNYLEASNDTTNIVLNDINITPLNIVNASSKYDQTWSFLSIGDQLTLSVEYNTDLFLETTIQKWVDAYLHLLTSALSHSESILIELSCIAEQTIQQELVQRFTPISHYYPLTANQRDIYVDSLIFPNSKHNLLGFLTESTAVLDITIWKQVVEQLYNHSDTLRARIIKTQSALMDIAYQVIAPQDELPQSCFTVFNHAIALDANTKQQAIQTTLYTPYNETEPLWRLHFHQYLEGKTLFILAAHHAMFDGVSLQILGRVLKGNYEKNFNQQAPNLLQNNYSDFVRLHRRKVDSLNNIAFWQAQFNNIQPLLNFKPHLHNQAAQLQSINIVLTEQEWQHIQQLCEQYKSTAVLFFKAIFCLTIKKLHNITQDLAITEVVLGRNKTFLTTQGLFFEQQPNVIPQAETTNDKTLEHFLTFLKTYRKTVQYHSPISLRQKQHIHKDNIPYLFNFYIMESSTPFMGHIEHIEHLIPEMDHAVNCIAKIIDDQANIQFTYNAQELDGVLFANIFKTIIKNCKHTNTVIAEICDIPLPDYLQSLPRFSQPSLAKSKEKKAQTKHLITPQETKLIQLWEEILGKKDITIEDNFFELGGHSLHALRIANRLREDFKQDLPLAHFFENPTIKNLAIALETFSYNKNTLPPISKNSNDTDYPLSSDQKRLYFLTQIDEANLAYNMPIAVELNGDINTAYIQQAISIIIERHHLLRSCIVINNGIPQWQLNNSDFIIIEHQSFTTRFAPEEENTLIQKEATTPFVINNAPLMRIRLCSFQQQRHILLITLHHLIADAQSLVILASELFSIYKALIAGNKPSLPALKLHYSDYSYWQNELLKNSIFEEDLQYWKHTLEDAPLLLGLPIDYARKATQSYQGKSLNFFVPQHITEALKKLSQENQVSLFMSLLLSYQLFLAQTCQQLDVCVGIPREGRFNKELEAVVGFFVHALVMRTRFHPGSRLSDLLQQVKTHLLNGIAHEKIPAEYVLKSLRLPTQLSYTPIVQAAFNFIQTPDLSALEQLDNVDIKVIPNKNVSAKFELLLTVTDINDELHAALEYNSDLFNDATIEHFKEQWLYLLNLIIQQPNSTFTELQLPDCKTTYHLSIITNHYTLHSAQHLHTITDAINIQSKNKIAVTNGTTQLSYAALEQQSNALAQKLLQAGINTGDRIGICIGKRVELLVAILATIKVRACYVPMDVNYPADRLAYMLDDCQAALVITESCMLATFTSSLTPFLNIDTVDLSVNAALPKVQASLDDLLYMIYTSGSTGKPKGATVVHRSEANLLAWYTQEFAFSAADKTLIISAIGFDLTQKNLFALLTVGGTVVFPDTEHFDVNAILACIEREAITIINCAPSALYALIELGGKKALQQLRSLRTVLLGGEPIHLSRLSAWISSAHFNCAIVNMYGPTECTDISTFHTLSADTLRGLAQQFENNPYALDIDVPLGKPNAGVNLVVLNEQLQAVPQGLVGELCVSGISVGAGYWNKPELTAAAFINNPFSTGDDDTVLYKTGDLVRVNPADGLLYYVGRKDFQVKLRGLRIELGEVEHALRRIPAIDDILTLVDNEQLLAFALTDAEHHQHGIEGWREALLGQLPDYMVPALLITLTEWPLTPNGKINRQALLALDRSHSSTQFVAPRTDIEKDIATLWQEVLGIGEAGVFDNFFEAGGDSLAAVRLVAGLEIRFNTKLPVSSLFGAQTIAQLAHIIHNQLAQWSPIVPIQPQGHKTPIFAVHAIGALVLSYEPLARALGKDQPFFGIQAYGFEENQTPYTDLNEMLEFYVAAILQQQPHGPYQLIGHSFGGILALEIARKLQSLGETINYVGLLDTHMPIEYANAAVDDAMILKTFAEHNFGVVNIPLRSLRLMKPELMIKTVAERFNGMVSEEFIRSAIAIIRGFQRMMIGFVMQPLNNIPVVLVTPEDLATKTRGLMLNLGLRRNIKTRGFEKITNNIIVHQVSGDHHSMLKVVESDVLVNIVKDLN